MTDLAALLADPATTIAVVGATDNPGKYGYVIYRDLRSKGYNVYPVNKHRSSVGGDPAFPNLTALPVKPDIVDIVVPPDQTLKVLEETVALGLPLVWVQPGAEDAAVEEFIADHDLEAVVNACIMVRSRVSA